MSVEFQNPMSASPTQEKRERVGIIVVHGIGRQQRFEHLQTVVNSIVRVFKEDDNLQVELVAHPQHLDEKVVVWIRDSNGHVTELHFHEVWWADVAPRPRLSSNLYFWAWASSLWTKSRYLRGSLSDVYQDTMSYPGPSGLAGIQRVERGIPFVGRVRLFFTSFLFILIVPLLATVNNVILPIFKIRIPLDYIPEFMGKIKLFTQASREKGCPLEDAEYPPRVAIRRRMIKALATVATQGYDRWYVLAHSLGSVIAFNGLMESEQLLPSYLPYSQWDEVKRCNLHDSRATEDKEAIGKTRPSRPFWLNENDLLSRRKLFNNLQGFMTYGSPLSKFAVLWPDITLLNRDEKVFSLSFEWINIYDPTDPVAGPALSEFSPLNSTESKEDLWIAPKPKDIVHDPSFSRFHLLSHLSYLQYSRRWKNKRLKREKLLADSVAYWLLKGDKFVAPNNLEVNRDRWSVLRDFTWVIAGVICLLALAILVPIFINQTFDFAEYFIYNVTYKLNEVEFFNFRSDDLPTLIGFFGNSFLFTTLLVFSLIVLSGSVRWLVESGKARIFNLGSAEKEIRFYFTQNPRKAYTDMDLLCRFERFYSKKVLKIAIKNLHLKKIIQRKVDDTWSLGDCQEIKPFSKV
jgi:hypothetical protein